MNLRLLIVMFVYNFRVMLLLVEFVGLVVVLYRCLSLLVVRIIDGVLIMLYLFGLIINSLVIVVLLCSICNVMWLVWILSILVVFWSVC